MQTLQAPLQIYRIRNLEGEAGNLPKHLQAIPAQNPGWTTPD